jgi:hypothetical protein
VECLEGAARVRPGEVSTYLDLGDAHLDGGRLEAAREAYGRALGVDEANVWAQVSQSYASALQDGVHDVVWGHGNDPRARALALDLRAYQSRISDPIDPVVRVIRDVEMRASSQLASKANHIRVRSDRPLAPSARVAFAHVLRGRAGSLAAIGQETGGHFGPLWETDGPVSRPRFTPPPPQHMKRVANLATAPFHWDTWNRNAHENPVDDHTPFIHAMPHPPEPPGGGAVDPWLANRVCFARGSRGHAARRPHY